MKKQLIFLLSLFVFAILGVNAQDKIGAELGVAFSDLRGETLPNSRKSITTFHAGGFYEMNVTGAISLKGLVSLEKRGYEVPNSFFDDVFNPGDIGEPNLSSSDLTFSTDYLNITLLGKYSFGENIQFYINAGPYVGLNLRSQSPANSGDFGITSGLGLQKNFGKISIFMEGRNSFGLSNTFKSPNIAVEADIKTIAFYALVGLAFEI